MFKDIQNGIFEEDVEIFDRFQEMTSAQKEQYTIKLMEDNNNKRQTNMLVSALSRYTQNGKKKNVPDIRIQGMNASIAVKKLQTSVRNSSIFDMAFGTKNKLKQKVKGNTSSKANVLTFLEFNGAKRDLINGSFDDKER
jgi:hypothetical protein